MRYSWKKHRNFIIREGERMSEFFNNLIEDILLKKSFSNPTRQSDGFSKESKKIYNKVIDTVVSSVFENTIENDLLCIVFKSLSRTERIIILFNVLMDYGIADTAYIIGTNKDSVYNLKCRALKKFKKAIEDLDK